MGRTKNSDRVLNQTMLDGKTGGSTTRGDVDLTVDEGEVPVDRTRTDDELLVHLSIGYTLGHQVQHLHLMGS